MSITQNNTAIDSESKWWKLALGLSYFTILYNIAEGILSVIYGWDDEFLTLFGFGIDSFIETISGIGILVMVYRIRKAPVSDRYAFEKMALYTTGVSFFILALGLVITALLRIYQGGNPDESIRGIIISSVSILIMWILLVLKKKTGKALQSEPILADANCTLICMYMSLILLASSLVYKFTHWPYLDAIGALGIAWFSFSEGKECFEKARYEKYCSCTH